MKTPREIYDMGFEAGLRFASIVKMTEDAISTPSTIDKSKAMEKREKQREYQRRYLAAKKLKSYIDRKK